jgi:hypothetical protein
MEDDAASGAGFKNIYLVKFENYTDKMGLCYVEFYRDQTSIKNV